MLIIGRRKPAFFMSRVLQNNPVCFQWFALTNGWSTQHDCNMEQVISRETRPTPAKPGRSLNTIVDAIVLELGDVEGEDGKLVALVLPEDETRALVRRAIEDLTEFFARWNTPFSREGRATMAKDAGELADLIAAVESKLKRLPDPLADYLFGPPIARYALIPADDIMAATLADKEVLLERLERLGLGCERQKPPPPSSGPEQDLLQNRCGALARNLMKVFTRRPIKSTDAGPYRVIASLVYEAFTGEVEVDLKRACDRALHSTVT